MPTVQLRLPSGEVLCSRFFPAETALSEVEEAGGAKCDRRFVKVCIISAAGSEIEPDHTLASLMVDGTEDGEAEVLELGVLLAPKLVEMPLTEVMALEEAVPAVTALKVTLGTEDISLECLAQKFPSLTKLEFVIPQHTKAGAPASYWGPIQRLQCLERLHFSNHHSFTRDGHFKNQVFESLLAWEDREQQLKAFSLTGAMLLDLRQYKEFIETNNVLSPELEEFSVYHWFANPPQVDDNALQRITKRYQHLKTLEVGSCSSSVSDRAFKYLGDNSEGVQAGQELEKLFLVCTTNVQGEGWLSPDSVKRCLPKLREFKLGGGQVFCGCGRQGCGDRAHVLRELKAECGVSVEHSAPHW